MLSMVLRKLIGSNNDRIIKKYQKVAHHIGTLENIFEKLSDDELRHQTIIFKQKLRDGSHLDDILPEAFAVVREASKRTLGQRPFDVQLVGGQVLHHGMLAEMKTGEGKTLVATLPVYLNALTEKGVHVVTVNDYLAKRDSSWMGQIYEFLGLSVGCIVHGMNDEQRRRAYASDITYGTNHEFGFDYLRDNMKFRKSDLVMRNFHYAIVDEVDSILIDEARTPLIISGAAEDSSDLYKKINEVILLLQESDFEKDEKQHTVILTESGIEAIEKSLSAKGILKGSTLYDLQNISVVHHVNAALRAHKLYTRDVDYIVKNDEVIIIDEFTGRMMEGRRYSEGLHQAIEAKENVTIAEENQTLASITYQNFFRLYPKISGMAGTAMTEADEFEEIYSLKAVEIPPNVPVTRKDYDDEIYLTALEKYKAVTALIKECQNRGQPVLVGTTSIEKSELISNFLKKEKIQHNVLNARQHEKEAYIVAEAGKSGMVTVATNMAGRGTDIKLGGNWEMLAEIELAGMPEGEDREKALAKIKMDVEENHKEVIKAGGLYIIGTERHESRRIDNQLRGRAGRQGDPGASKFFISLQDDLMRIFAASDKLDAMLRRLGAQEDEVISHRMISKALEKAQLRVEARNFDLRKHLLRYDDVMNDQRKIIYSQRRELIEDGDIKDLVEEIKNDVIDQLIATYLIEDSTKEQWDLSGLCFQANNIFAVPLPLKKWEEQNALSETEVRATLQQMVEEHLQAKEVKYGADLLRGVEKTLLLRVLDQSWKDHLLNLDNLRQGINLRAYAQGNPLNEYKNEAFNLFRQMLEKLKMDFISLFAHSEASNYDAIKKDLMPAIVFDKLKEIDGNWENTLASGVDQPAVPWLPLSKTSTKQSLKTAEIEKNFGKVSRNAVCSCGSKKKYKHCHGATGAIIP